jgi:hypothetical protein
MTAKEKPPGAGQGTFDLIDRHRFFEELQSLVPRQSRGFENM